MVPDAWIKESTEPREKSCSRNRTAPPSNFGYGYQWWLLNDDDGALRSGIYGPTIYINPKRHLVIVQTAWPQPDPERWDETIKVMQTVARKVGP